jgi:CRP-like cAMP-binding protein
MSMNELSVRTGSVSLPHKKVEVCRDDPFVARLRHFTEISPQDIDNLRAVVETELVVKKRRDLVLDGYEFSKLCFVKEGFAARYKLLRNGKRQIVNFIVPGDVVGLPGSFLDRAANSVIAVSEMTLQICPLESFVDLCYRQPKFGLLLSWRTPIERLAHLLLELHARLVTVGRASKSEFTLPFTQEMMSDALGLSVPHLNRMLTKLRADGLVAIAERHVEFVDLKGMQQLAQFQSTRPARIPLAP